MPNLKGFPRVLATKSNIDFITVVSEAEFANQTVSSTYKKSNLKLEYICNNDTNINTLTLRRLDSNEVLVTATTGMPNEAAFDGANVSYNSDWEATITQATEILTVYRP